MDFQSLQNDLKDWLRKKAQAAASVAQSADQKVQKVENYLGIKRMAPPPNPISSPKEFIKDQLVTRPVQTVKNIVNPILEGLNVVTSYPLGGMVKAISETSKNTYRAPKTGVTIGGRDIGDFINPSIVGAIRGIKNKQTLFDEVPKAAGVTNPVGAFALGLGSELAVPIPGPGKGRALKKVGEEAIKKGRALEAITKAKLNQGLVEAAKAYPTFEEFLGAFQKRFHQTSFEAAKAIEEGGFLTKRGKSGYGDPLPVGVNTKGTDAKIGIQAADSQLEVFFDKAAKTMDFPNRDAVKKFLTNSAFGKRYTSLLSKMKQADAFFAAKINAMEAKANTFINDQERYGKALDAMDPVLAKWKTTVDDLGEKAAIEAKRIFKKIGVKAINISEDIGGAFGNKVTDNTIVLDESLLKTKEQMRKVYDMAQKQINLKDTLDPEKISDVLFNTLKKNPGDIFLKPGRLSGEGFSLKEASTGLAENGQDIAGRIRVALNDAGQTVIDDGTHLLEAYRQLKLPVPLRKLSFSGEDARNAFQRGLVEAEKALNPKTLKARFTEAINKSKSQEEAADNLSALVDRIAASGDQKLMDLGKKAINAQLARFQNFRGNPKAAVFFNSLEKGFEKLSDVPFGATGMFKRTDANSMKQEFENFLTMKGGTDPARTIVNPEIASMAENLTDLNPMRSAFSDLTRNLKKVFGDSFQVAKEKLLDPFNQAKANFVADQERLLKELDENIVKGLGIEKGSELSKFVQAFGEKKMTLGELQNALPDKWQTVVKADEWFRARYDSLLDEVNAVRAKIYPNNPEKIIPKRSDYYRHFQEMAEGFKGLLNIFESPAAIPSPLAGVSEGTKPKSRWASFMQARTGDRTKLDAVGGFLDYIKASMYAKNIDPTIESFRGLAADLRQVTKDEGGRLNNFIIFLDDFANDLAGKTNKLDRAIQDWIPGNRKTMAVLDWANSRFKINAIVGNVSSAINQALALPAAVADAGVKNTIKAIPDTLANIFKEGASASSPFLRERYLSSAYDKFDKGFVASAKKSASWLLQSIEETATRLVWNAQYERALGEGLPDAIKQADEWTRNIVAGRGVGEVPLAQKSRIFQMALPFQLEVANLWLVVKDWMDAKTFGKVISFAVASNLMNSALQGVTGQRPGYDPIAALATGLQNSLEGKDEGTGIKPFVGETLSNIPGGGFITRAMFSPEQSQKIFGDNNDPAKFDRYGTGIPLASAIKPVGNVLAGVFSGEGVKPADVTQVVEYFGLPFGGGQIKKTLGGASMLAQGGRFDKEGGLQFPTDPDLSDKLGSLVFGPYSTDTARFYFDQNLTTLTAKETAAWKQGVSQGKDPIQFWLDIQKGKVSRGLRDKVREIMRDPTIPQEEKPDRVSQLQSEYNRLMERLTNFKP